nr:integrase, catalytic region, zinc finger, CCHC-type, peptidase aspartic, catalytic [Tanacetum cinerariifolium]
MGDRVMRNNSQGKKQEVEDPRRSVKFSKNKTSVTACNDSLNAKTLNVNFMCATCDTCMLNEKHDMYVLNSVAKPLKKTVASESKQKPRNITRKLYERIRTVKFGNDQIAPILGYGDMVQGAITIKRVYYVEGLNHNLFSVGQFCDADLEVAFRKSTCYICDLKGNDLLIGLSKKDFKLKRDSSLNVRCSNTLTKWHCRRRNRTLVEAARTMLSAAKVPLFFWAEA